MKKIGLLKLDSMGDYEKEKGFASYRTIVDRFIGDIVLCNNIIDVDFSIIDNMQNGERFYNSETGEEVTEQEYNEDTEGIIGSRMEDIYQYYLCNIDDYSREILIDNGFIISYSDKLECDVLCVDHYGTSWDYVLTDIKLFETYEELEKYEKENEDNE